MPPDIDIIAFGLAVVERMKPAGNYRTAINSIIRFTGSETLYPSEITVALIPLCRCRISSRVFNRYSYTLNNPLRYTDSSGEFFFVAALIGIFLNAACWGAAIGAATYTAM